MTFSSLHHYLIAASILLLTIITGNKLQHQTEATASLFSNNPVFVGTTNEEFCAAQYLHEAALEKDKTLRDKVELLEQNWLHWNNQQKSKGSSKSLMVTLPVVFHIIHNNGPENLANAEIIESFDFLNNAFANEAPYDPATGVNTQIQFCIAKEDPNGNPTTGINHVVSPLTEVTIETEDINMKDVSRWDPTRYINIWVVKEICSNASGCGIAGYAYFPTSHGNPEDGLVVEAQWLGGTPGDATVLSHEMGHYLGLYHTFQNGCNNTNCLLDGDRVCDTPPDQSTVASPCNIDINSCTTDVNPSDPNNPFTSDQNDMFWNYMDYGEWDCYSAFTQGQAERMDFFINTVRFSLLGQTLCENPCANPMTLLIGQGDTIVNVGTTLTFPNSTIGATSFEWEVNGMPVSTATNLSYTFSPEGTYQITLNAFNGDPLCDASLTITVIAFDCEGDAHVSDSNGVDVANCGGPGNPCKTIQYALDNVLCSGDTIFIHSGNYQLPAGTNAFTPIAWIPENYSVTFYGVEDNGPVVIDGNNERRGFLYSYFGGTCPYDSPNDGINVTHQINFVHLSIQNTYDAAALCTGVYQNRGAGICILNSPGSDLTVQIQNCIFSNNVLEDLSGLNNNGRSSSGAAVYIHGLVFDQTVATTHAKVLITDADFTGNSATQNDNGGHGGAVCLVSCDTAEVRHSYFCNNSLYSQNSDSGDLNFDRNAGGALLIMDQLSQFPGHQYTVAHCTFIGNSATTANGATFTDQSEGGAIFLTSGDGAINNTSATLRIGNCHFYDNTIETGIEHVDNNSGTLDLNSLGNNVFADELNFSLGGDTLLCAGSPLFAAFLPGATYEWSTGETTSSIIIAAAGTYAVTVSLGQCSVMDEVFISVESCDPDCEDTWYQTIGTADMDEGGTGIIESGDGNFYVKGYQDNKVLISKITSAGEVIWTRTFKFTSQPNERLYDLDLDSEGFLIGGGNGNSGNTYFGFVFKYDPDNDILIWSKELSSQMRISGILENSPSEDYIIYGHSFTNAAPGNIDDAFLIRIDRQTGNVDGASSNHYTSVGTTDQFQNTIAYNNAIYTCGLYNTTGTFPGARGGISKFDFAGNLQWAKYTLVPLSSTARLYCSSIIEDQDSLVTAHFGSQSSSGSAYSDKIFLTKSDTNGNTIWAKSYQMPGHTELLSHQVVSTSDGYLIVSNNRTTPRKIILLKVTKNGIVEWAKGYAPTGGVSSMETFISNDYVLVKNDRIYIAGESTEAGSANENMLIIKTELNGNILSPCPFIADIDVIESTFPIPFDDDVAIITYDSPITAANSNTALDSISLITAQSCIGACTEICDNGIDDDNDGLIDCFDPDCCSSQNCLTYYYNECALDCPFPVSPSSDIELEIEWESNDFDVYEWCSYNTPITGDIDGDGIPEIIGKPCPSIDVPGSLPYPNLLIIDGATGQVENMILTPAFYYAMDAPAIADVDGDGFAEIFVHASDISANSNYAGTGPFVFGNVQRRILCYEYDGTNYVERWMSAMQIGYTDDQQALAVSVADFNGDGIPELHCGNQILNSLTGELLVIGGATNHNGSITQGDDPSLSQAYAVAADVLPDDFCTHCSGLELVAGGMVYSVNIDPTNPANNTMTVEVALPGAIDGWTSIADLDKDGDLDAVVCTTNGSNGLLYAWDIQTPVAMYDQYLTPPSVFGYISQANIADFDGDGFVEIGICGLFKYQVLKPQGATFSELWSIITDDGSGSTGSSAFDFNNDGKEEIIYRTETELLVLDGPTGTVLSSQPCVSGTRLEYPVVVDVDADGETELLCSCDGKLTAFGSASILWPRARSVWNQRNYFNVNIADDLRVPAIQQQHHIVGDSVVLNNFLTMYGVSQGAFADATAQIDSVICNGGDFLLSLTICNIGDNTLPGETPIAFYNSNPTTGAADTLMTTSLGQNLLAGSCSTFVINVPSLFEVPIFVVVNDDYSLIGPYDLASDFPVTAIAECDYTNNIDSFLIPNPEPPVLDLGPDTLICDNGVLSLQAGSGFDSYLWFDGSTDSTNTIYGPGEYWVAVSSICGVQRDTIEVFVEAITDIMLPPQVVLCGEACTTLEVSEWFDSYQWIPSDYLDCANCATVVACPPVATTYIVIGSSNLGCFSIDTITVIPVQPMYTVLDTAICLGDVVEFNGVNYPIGTTEIFTVPGELGCMDTIELNVTWNGGQDAPTLAIDALVCDNEVFIFDGVEIAPNSSQTFNYQTYLGCDSVIIVGVGALPTYETNLSETICMGDSILIFGNYETAPGVYNMTFTSTENCDSVVNVTLGFYSAMTLVFSVEPTCPAQSDGFISSTVSGGAGNYSYLWSNDATTATISNLAAGLYTVTVTDGNSCIIEGSAMVDNFQADPTFELSDPTCNGTATGGIVVTNAEPGWMFALDDNPFQADPFFNGLEAGQYRITIIDENGCEIVTVVALQAPPAIVINGLPNEIEVFVDETYTFPAEVSGIGPYLYSWSPTTGLSCPGMSTVNCLHPTVSGITEETTYTLTVSIPGNENCFEVASITVIPKIQCDGTYALPNAFTPNGDGQNDVFRLLHQDNGIRVSSFTVFDRWGEMVYEGEGDSAGWNGTYKGKPMPMDSYIYQVKLICPDGVDVRELMGDVSLVR